MVDAWYVIGVCFVVLFIETPVFTRVVAALLDDEALRALEHSLMERPDQGALLQGGHGVRKLRWAVPGSGKRGGLRIIYYWHIRGNAILFLHAYRKSRTEDLTPHQVRVLAEVIRKEYPS